MLLGLVGNFLSTPGWFLDNNSWLLNESLSVSCHLILSSGQGTGEDSGAHPVHPAPGLLSHYEYVPQSDTSRNETTKTRDISSLLPSQIFERGSFSWMKQGTKTVKIALYEIWWYLRYILVSFLVICLIQLWHHCITLRSLGTGVLPSIRVFLYSAASSPHRAWVLNREKSSAHECPDGQPSGYRSLLCLTSVITGRGRTLNHWTRLLVFFFRETDHLKFDHCNNIETEWSKGRFFSDKGPERKIHLF